MSGGYGLFVNSGVLHRYEAHKGNVLTPNIVFLPVLLAAEESLIYEKYVLPVITTNGAAPLEDVGDHVRALERVFYRFRYTPCRLQDGETSAYDAIYSRSLR